MRNSEEIKVLEDFKGAPPNVKEAWALYDTIVVCSTFFGNETSVQGWFNNFVTFGQQPQHSFFKSRTLAQAGQQYCNQMNADTMDFAFVADSIGLAIIGPSPGVEGQASDPDGAGGDLTFPDNQVGHWFQTDMVNHLGFEFKVQQDVRAEMTAMHMPPGYGSVSSGVAYQFSDPLLGPVFGNIPYAHNTVCQGVPILSNRFPLPDPIGIPRTGTIEGILHISPIAQTILQNITGPRNYQFNSADGLAPYTFFPRRYSIQFSLIGTRMVQQRAQYHR